MIFLASVTAKQELVLGGCTPEPLMAYLKALGVLRLVAEQREPEVRAWWRGDNLVLEMTLPRDSLVEFFLRDYQPTPIVAPWNGGSGFREKDNKVAMNAILQCAGPRLEKYRKIIESARDLVAGTEGVREKDRKEMLLAACRNWLPEDGLTWLDAAYVLGAQGPQYPPLLGTGGNDGRLEFSNNFMQNLVSALGMQTEAGRNRGGGTVQGVPDLLTAALFGEGSPPLLKERTAGQFSPGSIGGPNATVGFEAGSLTNPWDYVLMIEGALVFAGAVARRLSFGSRSRAVFPFTVDTSAAGYGTAVDAEYGQSARSETWMPLWDRPATYREIAHVFGEGRAQLGARQASTGTDFARAIAGLGVERGISEFVRFGLLMRSGRAYLATPLGRFRVRANPRADVLFDVDGWLGRLRSLVRGQGAPEGLGRALRQVDQAIIELCQGQEGQGGQDTARGLQHVLMALGRVETWLARSRARERVPPLSGLRPDWLREADDGSAEFRIAAAVASIQGASDGRIGSLRANLEPVGRERGRWAWTKDKDNPSVVWHDADLVRNMAAVLERRCLDARMKGADGEQTVPIRGRVSVTLSDICAFLEGRLDERRIADLILPLSALRWQEVEEEPWERGQHEELALPLAYAALKLLVLPWKFRRGPGREDVAIRPEPSLVPLLRASRTDDAYLAASRRLYASGFTPVAKEAGTPARLARRLAAAILIPVRYQDMFTLADLCLVPPIQDA